MKRSALRADPNKTRAWQRRSRRRLPAESAKRIRERPLRRQVVAQALARDGGCVGRALIPGHVCRGPLVGHERIPRSLWPGGHLVLDNVLTVCSELNGAVKTDEQAAIAHGLHAPSWERPQ